MATPEHLYLELARAIFGERVFKNKNNAKQLRDTLACIQETAASDDAVVAVKDGDLDALDEACDIVTRTVDTLVDVLKKYNGLYTQRETYTDMIKALKTVDVSIRKTMEDSMGKIVAQRGPESSEDHDKWMNELREHVDGISYSLDFASSAIDAQRSKIDDKLQSYASVVRRMSRVYGELKPPHGCPVCLSREVNMFCDPCGHCFCDKCIRGSFCYICRTDIRRVSPLFFC